MVSVYQNKVILVGNKCQIIFWKYFYGLCKTLTSLLHLHQMLMTFMVKIKLITLNHNILFCNKIDVCKLMVWYLYVKILAFDINIWVFAYNSYLKFFLKIQFHECIINRSRNNVCEMHFFQNNCYTCEYKKYINNHQSKLYVASIIIVQICSSIFEMQVINFI